MPVMELIHYWELKMKALHREIDKMEYDKRERTSEYEIGKIQDLIDVYKKSYDIAELNYNEQLLRKSTYNDS